MVGALIGGCGPGECKEAKPLIGELRAALANPELTGAAEAAEKLNAALVGGKSPELAVLKRQTEALQAALKKAQVAPTDESGLAARDLAATNLGVAVTVWQESAALVDTKICN